LNNIKVAILIHLVDTFVYFCARNNFDLWSLLESKTSVLFIFHSSPQDGAVNTTLSWASVDDFTVAAIRHQLGSYPSLSSVFFSLFFVENCQ